MDYFAFHLNPLLYILEWSTLLPTRTPWSTLPATQILLHWHDLPCQPPKPFSTSMIYHASHPNPLLYTGVICLASQPNPLLYTGMICLASHPNPLLYTGMICCQPPKPSWSVASHPNHHVLRWSVLSSVHTLMYWQDLSCHPPKLFCIDEIYLAIHPHCHILTWHLQLALSCAGRLCGAEHGGCGTSGTCQMPPETW